MSFKVAAIRVLVASLVLVNSLLMTAEANTQALDRGLSLRELALELNTPEAIADFLWKNIQFEKDQRQFGVEEYWQKPEELLQNRKGDCEDFAVLAHQLFKMNGISSYILNLYGGRYAHTVCVFKERGKYNVMDLDQVRRIEANSLSEVAESLHSDWDKAAIVEPKKESRSAKIISEFERRIEIQNRIARSA